MHCKKFFDKKNKFRSGMDIPKALNSCNQGQEPFYHSDRSAFTTVIPNFQGILTNNDTTNIHFGNFPLGESFFNIEQPV